MSKFSIPQIDYFYTFVLGNTNNVPEPINLVFFKYEKSGVAGTCTE